jgi:hypothetical protein
MKSHREIPRTISITLRSSAERNGSPLADAKLPV